MRRRPAQSPLQQAAPDPDPPASSASAASNGGPHRGRRRLAAGGRGGRRPGQLGSDPQANQQRQHNSKGRSTTAEVRAVALGAHQGSAEAARLAQLLEEEEEDEEEEARWGNSSEGDYIYGEAEVEELVFGGKDFSAGGWRAGCVLAG